MELEVESSLEEVFRFFSQPENLETLTPPWLKFEIAGSNSGEMREGLLIDYRLRLHGIPVRWRSKITSWVPGEKFIDEQLRGPYRMWKHEHIFEKTTRGTLITDNIIYAVPGGVLFEGLVNRLFVRPDLEKIFAFRKQKTIEMFGVID